MRIALLSRAQLEILNKRGLRYNLQDAQKDYFLAIVLKILYRSKVKADLVFKGGTAIYHCYLDQLRFSKDLDFTSKRKLSRNEIEEVFADCDVLQMKSLEERKFSLDLAVQYQGLLNQPDSIALNINTNQKVLIKPKTTEYRNYYGVKVSCLVMNIHEIFAEKMKTLLDRAKPRDPYDLVMLRRKFGLKIEEGLALLTKKELHSPISRKQIKENLKIAFDAMDQEMRMYYYRESVSKAELNEFAKELMDKLAAMKSK